MEVIICEDAAQVARTAAQKVAHVLQSVSGPGVLGVATGSSPLGIYTELAGMIGAGQLDLAGATAFALDEYVGLPPGHPESYAAVIERTVTRPLGLDPLRVHVPDGAATDIPAACAAYERSIADCGGIDVQILGVGRDGHIGFNEPGSSFASRTRIKTLTPQTRQDNARFFDSQDEVPHHCLTQGLGTIMEAQEVVLVAQGEAKAQAVAGAVEGPVTASCPGSILQFHPRATVVVDLPAAAGLRHAEYYRHAYATKPQWQRFEC